MARHSCRGAAVGVVEESKLGELKRRLIWDGVVINCHTTYTRVCYDQLAHLPPMLRRGDYSISWDDANGFHHLRWAAGRRRCSQRAKA